MLIKYCSNCKRLLSLSQFFKREDRIGHYSFCKTCMDEQGREVGYPAPHKRGGGSLELISAD